MMKSDRVQFWGNIVFAQIWVERAQKYILHFLKILPFVFPKNNAK